MASVWSLFQFPTILHTFKSFFKAPHPLDDPSPPTPACPCPTPIFAFLYYLWLLFDPIPIPHNSTCFCIVFHNPPSPELSIPSPWPCLTPSHPHFRFFWIIYGFYFAHIPIPHNSTYLFIVFQSPPIPWMIPPPPTPACPPNPTPIFAFLKHLWTHFCRHFYPIPLIHVHIWVLALNREYLTTFFECNKLPWKEKWITFYGRKKAPKKRPNIHTYSLVHNKGIPYSMHAAGRPCGSILQPAVDSRAYAQPPKADGLFKSQKR